MALDLGRAQAWLGERLVAESDEALILNETGRSPYPPVAYFPRAAVVEGARLEPSARRTSCPLKGTARYFDLVADEARVSDGVWAYDEVLGFDEGLRLLEGRVAFDARSFRVTVDP